jgi:hypothetical protein BACCOPRO_02414
VCNYRKNLLIGNIDTNTEQIVLNIAELSGFNIKVIESDKEHIQMRSSCGPKVSPLQIKRQLKQISTTAIEKRQGAILQHIFWKENICWADGYFIATVQNVSLETIKKYIENQE